MRRSSTGGQLVMCCVMMAIAIIPALAARPPYEKILNGITIKSTYLDVLAKRGVPHYIGPSIGGTEMLLSIIDPTEAEPTMQASTPSIPVGGRATPGNPAGISTPEGTAAVPMKRYMVWMYEGTGALPDPKAGWNTYVFLNMMGEVEGVVVALTNYAVKPPVKAESGVTFGARMNNLVKEDMYGWPQQFRKVGDFFFLQYPDKNIAFALDLKSRAVVQISIGLPMVVSNHMVSPAQGGASGAAGGLPGTLPKYPGGAPQTPKR